MKKLLIALTMAITSFYPTLAFQFEQLIKPATFEHVKIKQFEDAINISLPELKDRIGEIPTDKPIVVVPVTAPRQAAVSSKMHSKNPKSWI